VAEYRAWLQSIGLEARVFVPIAARQGDNIASLSSNMPWWTGPTVVATLDDFRVSESPASQSLRFPVQDVYRFDERRILAGRVESGTLRVGDRLVFCPGNKASSVKTIERWNCSSRDEAFAGESIGITLTEQIFVERGALAALESAPPYELTRFKARLFWLGKQPFRKGRKYKLKLATQEVECQLDKIERVIDASTLQPVNRPQAEAQVERHEVGEITIKTRKPAAFDAIDEIVPTGRFVIVDGLDVAGGGIIVANGYPRRTAGGAQQSQNLYLTQGNITHEHRARRNGHPGSVIWLTGLSGAGKSTLAAELERELFDMGQQAYVLDGDNVRHGLNSDLGFSPRDRRENIRRVGEVARLFADAGIICITAFISPYREDREAVRRMVPPGRFVEVYVNAPLAVCEERDVKGLYAKARTNEVKEFTGVAAPYEPPLKPEIELRTDQLAVADSVRSILEFLHLLDSDTSVSI
jgi:bifunctional enzyme CysN/CysC